MTTTLGPTTDSAAAPAPAERSTGSARIVALVVAVAMLSLLALMIWGIGHQAAGSVGTVPVAVRPAPPFTIQLFEGSAFDLAALKGKPVLVNFWASWCIPCEQEAATLERTSRTYKDRVAFVGVDVQDTDGAAREFVRRFGVSYPNGPDPSGAISVEYGMSGVPETYFVDRTGTIVRKWQGPLDDQRLAGFLDDLLK